MRRRFEGVSVDEGEGGGSEDASCARGRAPRRRARAGAADAFRLPEGKHSERASFWRSILGVAVHVARLTLGQQRYGSASTPCLPAGGRPVHPLGVRDELGCTGCRSGVEQGGKVRRKAPALRRTSRKGTKAGGTRAKRAERNTDGAGGSVAWMLIIIQEFLFPCSCAPAPAAPLTTSIKHLLSFSCRPTPPGACLHSYAARLLEAQVSAIMQEGKRGRAAEARGCAAEEHTWSDAQTCAPAGVPDCQPEVPARTFLKQCVVADLGERSCCPQGPLRRACAYRSRRAKGLAVWKAVAQRAPLPQERQPP